MSSLYSFLQRFNIVRQIPIFSKLRWFDLQRVARKTTIVEHKKGDIICRQDDPPDFFYCLISGRVQAYTKTDHSIRDHIEFIHRGAHFGIISILTGENHSQTFEVINDSVVLKISKDDFHGILQSVPQLGVELSQSLSRRIHKRTFGSKHVFESSIISIYSPVKGTGSSTYSINLALSLAKQTRKKVILVNISPRSQQQPSPEAVDSGASPLWKIGRVDLGDLIGDYDKIDAVIHKSDSSIDLINVSIDMQDATVKKQISPFVSTLVGNYHYVVVDLPNHMDDIVLETLTQADFVHVMANDDKENLNLVRKVIDQLQLNLDQAFREEKIKVIIRAPEGKTYTSFEEINKFINYHVYTCVPFVPPSELTLKVESQFLSFMRPSDHSEYAKTLRHIAREIGKVRVGIALGGGAALGLAHIGVIRVLEENDISVDVIVGSSMGALVGALWAIGKNAKELEEIAAEFSSLRNMLKLVDLVIPLSGVIGGRAIARWLKKHLGNKTFYDCKIPFKVVTYDLNRRDEIIVTEGTLVEAVRRSIAIPGVIEPIKENGMVVIDGGVLNPLPTNVLAASGIKKIIGVNVLQSPQQTAAGFEIEKNILDKKLAIPFREKPGEYIGVRISQWVGKVFFPNIPDIIVRTLQATEYVIAEESYRHADVNIHPDLVGIYWFELHKYKELIIRGEEATKKALPQIQRLIDR